MAVIDSRTPGALSPSVVENADNFLDPLRLWIAALVDLPREQVRASWLRKPGTQPTRGTTWCAVAVKGLTTTPVFRHGRRGDLNEAESGDVQHTSHEDAECVLSFYGPAGLTLAQRFRDSAQVLQNRRLLETQGLTLISLDQSTQRLPDLVMDQWIDRYDILFHVGRKVSRTYGIRTLTSADVSIFTERGKL